MHQASRVKYKIAQSNIHGNGVFATERLLPNEDIDIIANYLCCIPTITDHFGKWINHSHLCPNSVILHQNNSCWVRTKMAIPAGTEILINYGDLPWFIRRKKIFKVV